MLFVPNAEYTRVFLTKPEFRAVYIIGEDSGSAKFLEKKKMLCKSSVGKASMGARLGKIGRDILAANERRWTRSS